MLCLSLVSGRVPVQVRVFCLIKVVFFKLTEKVREKVNIQKGERITKVTRGARTMAGNLMLKAKVSVKRLSKLVIIAVKLIISLRIVQ